MSPFSELVATERTAPGGRHIVRGTHFLTSGTEPDTAVPATAVPNAIGGLSVASAEWDDPRLVVDEYLQGMRADGARPHTITGTRGRLRVLDREVGVERLTPETLLAFSDARGHVAGTRRLYYVTAAGFTRWARRGGLLDEDAFDGRKAPRKVRYVARPCSRDDVERVRLDAHPTFAAIITLAAYAGLRASEIAAVRGDHLRRTGDGYLLVIPEGKGGQPGSVPAHPLVVAAIGTEPGERFPGWDGKYLSKRTCEYLRRIGVAHSLHSFRHLYATRLYAATRDVLLVSRALRHANVATTAGYILDESAALDRAVTALD